MRPMWFDELAIPYHEMWEDDQYWMPQFLLGEDVYYSFFFQKDNKLQYYVNDRTQQKISIID